MKNEKLRDYISKHYPEVTFLDNSDYDNSIVGFYKDSEGHYRAVLDYDLMVEEYMEDNHCNAEDAEEWITTNTIPALPYIPYHPMIVGTIFRGLIVIPKENEETLDEWLDPNYSMSDGEFTEGERISFSTEFANGYRMYVDVCGVAYEEYGDNHPFTQATLNNDKGRELTFTEPSEELYGLWSVEYADDEYSVIVIKYSDSIEAIMEEMK